jgi:hypothetical protein
MDPHRPGKQVIISVAGSELILQALPAMLRKLDRRLCRRRSTRVTVTATTSFFCLAVEARLLSPMTTVLSTFELPTCAHACVLVLDQDIPAGSPVIFSVTALSTSTIALCVRALRKVHTTNKMSSTAPTFGTRLVRDASSIAFLRRGFRTDLRHPRHGFGVLRILPPLTRLASRCADHGSRSDRARTLDDGSYPHSISDAVASLR